MEVQRNTDGDTPSSAPPPTLYIEKNVFIEVCTHGVYEQFPYVFIISLGVGEDSSFLLTVRK